MSSHLAKQGAHYEREAKKYGLTTGKERTAGPLRFRWDLIERDIEALLNRRRDLPAGKPSTYPEPLVNYLASIYLGCCMIEGRPPSQELVHLIAQQLEVTHFGLKGWKRDALTEAQLMRQANPRISNRQIAKALTIETSTVGRWVKLGLLQRPATGVAA